MTLRVKNIIFFKIVCACLSYAVISYLINIYSDELSNSEIKNIKANSITQEAKNRLKVFTLNNEDISESVKTYQQLKKNENMNIEECYDKMIYHNKIASLEKSFKLPSSVSIYSSSNSVVKKDQPKKSVLLKTTSVFLKYNIDSFYSALLFSRQAYEFLPQYNLVRSIEISRNNTITPVLAKWFEHTSTVDLISVKLNMEVKEINLND